MSEEADRVRDKARKLLARAAMGNRQEYSGGPRVATSTMASAVAIGFRAGVTCDRDGCSAPAVVFRSRNGHTGAFCSRCRPKVENYRLETLAGVVAGWRGRGGETRGDRSVAACQRRLDAVVGR